MPARSGEAPTRTTAAATTIMASMRYVRTMLPHRVRIAWWFLNRPKLYPYFFYLVAKRLSLRSRRRDTRGEAESWCAARAVDTSSAIAQITGSPMPISMREKFHDVFVVADRRAAACPVEMGGAGNLDLLYWLAEHCAAREIVETGVAFGWSSLALLLSLETRPDSRLLSTDMPYPTRYNERYIGCVVPDELRAHWRIIDRADRQAIPRALKQMGAIDMCHYDSDKSYEGRIWAYGRLWDALRPGGLFVSDDVGDNLAFRDFAERVGLDSIVVRSEGKYGGILIKPSSSDADPMSRS
jgi:predicted O-methyltransferase YrrM